MILPVLAIALGLSACSSSSRSEVPRVKLENERKAAPEFALKDADGKTVRLADYRGKVVLLNFWATWCGPCKVEIPWFIEFERKLKDQGFAVIGVSMDDGGWEDVKPYISHAGINYRVLLGNDETAQLYGGVDSLPTTFIIDREGRIATVHLGLVSKSTYENDLREVIENPSRSAGSAGAGVRRELARAR